MKIQSVQEERVGLCPLSLGHSQSILTCMWRRGAARVFIFAVNHFFAGPELLHLLRIEAC